ncbi:7-cyano-7-deazaguanine synthase [Slackia heliotrinireducens]|uniref:7-cyano-7-deazaguanine synthase n=1 Tax=Slackia heliotrinireducens (strain ATCC 29202 / DSM 20476 / NCTC 11029 / RHS 1) TaxID=471855 RepID=C7N134_SLAHD|nr:7-cyano-7-deazaguanine synthase QueC [Slackia heliotrinireducens]ACV23256.1 exsB protein [Slackia heliotrinireducens DSM 20476]VEH02404.1 7-cyano-7-deazaguanine synthase [Slackia heliotrinireducens]
MTSTDQPTRAMVLSSGGVDSTTCLALACEQFGADNVTSVSVFYGQRHNKELACADAVAKHYGVAHHVLDLANILANSNNALMADSTQEIDHRDYATQIAENEDGMVNTYVPFRNGLMLSAVTALAISLNPTEKTAIYLGAHADDAAGGAYPDCTPEFFEAIARAIELGSYGKAVLREPFVNVNKADVVACGLKLGVPYELTWSCYEGGDAPCGTCATCIDRAKAFAANGVADPAL